MKGDGQVNSILRAIQIMETFASEKSEWSISDIAKELDLPVSTIHRQLATLSSAGYIRQDPASKKYQAGNKLILFASSVIGNYSLRNIAYPHLQNLSSTVQETVHLVHLDGFNMFYLEKVESPHSLSCNSRIGSSVPAHVASAGKILIAWQPESFIDDYCRQLPSVPPFTKKTIRDPDKLRKELKLARQQGYAIDNEESEEGVMCIAAPIFNMDGNITAAISISGPKFRVSSKLEQFIPLVRDTAQTISRMLGHASNGIF